MNRTSKPTRRSHSGFQLSEFTIMLLVYPPHFTMVMQKILGFKQGALWSWWKWWMSKNFGGRGRLLRAMACRKFLTCIACVERGKGKKEADWRDKLGLTCFSPPHPPPFFCLPRRLQISFFLANLQSITAAKKMPRRSEFSPTKCWQTFNEIFFPRYILN